MELFTPAAEVTPHIKILEMGDSSTGKTYDTFFLPGPLAGFDVEDGLLPYRDRFHFMHKKVYSIDELNEYSGQLISPEGRTYAKQFGTVAYDGISKLWHDEIARLQGSDGRIEFENMGSLKSPWKLLNSHIKTLGLMDLNVIATAHSKIDWEIPENGAPHPKGIKGDFDDRLFEAFDLVIYREREKDEHGNDHYTALVLKSRFGHLKLGQKIMDWDPEEQFAIIFKGLGNTPPASNSQPTSASSKPSKASSARRSAPVEAPEVATASISAPVTEEQQREIREICGNHGSISRGGKLEDSLVREAVPFLNGNGTQDEANNLLAKLREAVGRIQQQAVLEV